jgi:hypothetical protein
MGEACSTHEAREIRIIFWLENRKGKDHSEDPGVDGKTILE